jgi:hypothetical protein
MVTSHSGSSRLPLARCDKSRRPSHAGRRSSATAPTHGCCSVGSPLVACRSVRRKNRSRKLLHSSHSLPFAAALNTRRWVGQSCAYALAGGADVHENFMAGPVEDGGIRATVALAAEVRRRVPPGIGRICENPRVNIPDASTTLGELLKSPAAAASFARRRGAPLREGRGGSREEPGALFGPRRR